jgi:hypothetical protein
MKRQLVDPFVFVVAHLLKAEAKTATKTGDQALMACRSCDEQKNDLVLDHEVER